MRRETMDMRELEALSSTGEPQGATARPGAVNVLIVAGEATQLRIRLLLDAGRFCVAACTEPPVTIETAAAVCGELERAPDIAILAGGKELYAPGSSVEMLRTLLPESRLVVLSPSADRDTVARALRAGAWAVLGEERLEASLPTVLRAVHGGQLCLPGTISRRLDTAAFSPRERQVLELITRGLTNAQIARRLYLSESTVKSHLASSFRKLGLCSRAEAAAAWSEVLDDEAERLEVLERVAAQEVRGATRSAEPPRLSPSSRHALLSAAA